MDSRACIGVPWNHKNGTFDKLYHTSQKFYFKAQKEAIEYLWENSQKLLFSTPKLPFFYSEAFLNYKELKMKYSFFPDDFK